MPSLIQKVYQVSYALNTFSVFKYYTISARWVSEYLYAVFSYSQPIGLYIKHGSGLWLVANPFECPTGSHLYRRVVSDINIVSSAIEKPDPGRTEYDCIAYDIAEYFLRACIEAVHVFEQDQEPATGLLEKVTSTVRDGVRCGCFTGYCLDHGPQSG